jgi:hypothetical protein
VYVIRTKIKYRMSDVYLLSPISSKFEWYHDSPTSHLMPKNAEDMEIIQAAVKVNKKREQGTRSIYSLEFVPLRVTVHSIRPLGSD